MKNLTAIILLFLCFTGEIAAKSSCTFTVATYNLRYANKEDSLKGNGWVQRAPYIAKLIQFHGFDIFGTQEALHQQLQDLKNLLPQYNYIGVAREDGKQKGEHSAIFYRTDKFRLLDHGDFWLSQDQSKPNLGWDAACIRICTWGKFKEISSGKTFFLFNLHMDHKGVTARAESAKLILKKIQQMPQGTPVILSGDFNVDQFSPSYQLLNSSGILKDSYTKALLTYEPSGTFNGFDPNSTEPARIDHLFLTKDFKVLKYGILTDTYRIAPTNQQQNANPNSGLPLFPAHCPSDHYPVMAVVEVQ